MYPVDIRIRVILVLHGIIFIEKFDRGHVLYLFRQISPLPKKVIHKYFKYAHAYMHIAKKAAFICAI